MNRQQLKELLSNITAGQCHIGDDAKELVLDYAEAVQKASIIEALDIVQQALESAKKHVLLTNQAG
jgi:hypothetical protein